jgi:thiamine transport system substrate-binding protein
VRADVWVSITIFIAVGEVFGGDPLKHFLIFLFLVFGGLYGVLYLRNHNLQKQIDHPIVRVAASASFIAQWGPGPWLKNEFEKTCQCRVEFIDSGDTALLIQRLKLSTQNRVDVVLGIDQLDLELLRRELEWRPLPQVRISWDAAIQAFVVPDFYPYNWGQFAFVVRKGEIASPPTNLDALLQPELKDQLILQDPRTSSPGLNFLLWVIAVKGEKEGLDYIRKLSRHVKLYATSWSMAYGLFAKKQAKAVLSYTTSPLYHSIKERDQSFQALPFNEGHPLQVEFIAIPKTCTQCSLAEKFVLFSLSPWAQRVIMENNFMFPAISGVAQGTPFARAQDFKPLEAQFIPSPQERDRLIQLWTESRRGRE